MKMKFTAVLPTVVIVLTSLLWSSTLVLAATPTTQELEQIQREQDKILQDEQLRREDILKDKDMRRRPPGTVDLDIKRLEPVEGESKQCFEITKIILEGTYSLSDEERQKLTQPFIGKCLGLVEIRELMRVITNYYIDKGYVTTRAYIPQQDMSTGILKFLIIEGITGELELEKKEVRTNLATAFPGLKGKVLNIRDIEQGLDQINRLQSNNAVMELIPGDKPGRTNILIKNQPASPVSGTFALDNYGSESTGDNRGTITFGLDNPFGINDYWFLSLSRNTNSGDTPLSQSSMLNFDIPYGYLNFTGSYSSSEYRSLIKTPIQTLVASGGTDTPSLGVQYVLERSQKDKVTLTSQLVHSDTKNYIEGSLLTSSSRKHSVLKVNLIKVFSDLDGMWTISGDISKGLDWFGAVDLPNAGTGTIPSEKFIKFNFSASYSRPFKLMTSNASWSSSLQAQFSNDFLYGAQQIAVGGLYTVRGYDGTSIAGDRGLYWRNDIGVSLTSFTDPGTAKWMGRFQPYLAIDVGHIDDREGQTGGSLAGAAIGIRNLGGQVKFDFAYGVPVMYSKSISDRAVVEDHALYLKMTLNM